MIRFEFDRQKEWFGGGGGGGGGPGGAVVPFPTGSTGVFANQPQAQQGAFAGTEGIANNAFYPMPQLTSFLFPAGEPGTIAPQNQYTVQTSPGTPGTGGGAPSGPSGGVGFGESTVGGSPYSQDPGHGGGGYYGNPATSAQLAQDVLGTVEAGGAYAMNSPGGGTNLTPADMMELQQVASGQVQNQYITPAAAREYLSGDYRSALSTLGPETQQLADATRNEASWAAQQNAGLPTSGPGGAGGAAYGGQNLGSSPFGGGGGGGSGGTPPTYQTFQGPIPPQTGSELDPALAGFIGGPQGALADLEAGFGNSMGGWTGVQQAFGPGNASFLNNIAEAGSPQQGMLGGMDPLGGGTAANTSGAVGGTAPFGALNSAAQGPGGTLGNIGGSVAAGSNGLTGSVQGPNAAGQISGIGSAVNPTTGGGTFQAPNTNSIGSAFQGQSGQVFPSLNNGNQATNPLGNNFQSPGTGGLGQGQGGSGLNFSYPGAAAYLGLGPQIAASGNYLAPILQGAGGAVLNTAFDPQKALYNRTQQQITDQANAENAGTGVGSTPYGAGLVNQANENFNIDWQNQQLARQTQGLGAAAGAFDSSLGLQTGALQALQGGALGATAQSQQAIQDYLAYQAAATAQNNVNVQAYAAEANALQASQNSQNQASQAGTGFGLDALGMGASAIGKIATK